MSTSSTIVTNSNIKINLYITIKGKFSVSRKWLHRNFATEFSKQISNKYTQVKNGFLAKLRAYEKKKKEKPF